MLALVIAIARVEIIFTKEIPITFSLIVSYGRFGYNSSPSIPAIDLALQHIHSSGVLGEYKLQYLSVKDSEVSVSLYIASIKLKIQARSQDFMEGCLMCMYARISYPCKTRGVGHAPPQIFILNHAGLEIKSIYL